MQCTHYTSGRTHLEFAKHQRQHVDQPAKKTCDTVQHPRVASGEVPWLETTRVQKCMYMQDVLFNVKEHII